MRFDGAIRYHPCVAAIRACKTLQISLATLETAVVPRTKKEEELRLSSIN
jgi:hypothetical protein